MYSKEEQGSRELGCLIMGAREECLKLTREGREGR